MSEHDAEMYQRMLSKVRRQIQTLRIMLDAIRVSLFSHCKPKTNLSPFFFIRLLIMLRKYVYSSLLNFEQIHQMLSSFMSFMQFEHRIHANITNRNSQ